MTSVLVLVPPAQAAFPGQNGKLVFSRQIQAVQFVTPVHYDIFAMNGDGSGQDDLSDNDPGNPDARQNATSSESNPAFSPDGTKIVFDSDARSTEISAPRNLWVMNADGTGQRRLTTGAVTDVDPSFSPDGQKIAFQRSDEIYVMNADGTGIQRLTNNTSIDEAPAFSPDGTKIAFSSLRDGSTSEIYVMNADGSGQTRVTTNTTSDRDPTFSPDGKKIAFRSFRDQGGGPKADIYVMNVDGSAQTPLTNDASIEGSPVFSPDGTKIAFRSDCDGNDEIYLMNANGTGQTRLTSNAVPDVQPDWGRVPGSATQCSDGVDNDGDGKVDFGTGRDLGCDSPADNTENTDVAGPPDTTLTAGPSGLTSDNTPTFEFTSSKAGSSFECRVDGGVWASCSSPHTTAPLPNGQHTFEVRATDAAGVDPSPASRVFTVDATAPQTTITDGPSGTTNDDTPTFAFESSEEGSAFECRVDGAAFGPCTSPHTTGSLSDGQHTFEVRARDAAGNVDQSAASRTFTVSRSAADTTPPVTTVTAGPAGPTKDTTPTFVFESSETGSTFKCRVDGQAFASCSSPHTTAVLSEGPHTFEVQATDAAGNADPTPESRAFRVDTTAPQTTISEGPGGPTKDNTPTFEFESSEGDSTLECRVDDAAFAPCTSPHSTTTLGDGQHSFEVRATDAAGNTDPTAATRTFTVDVVVPETTIDSGPSGSISERTATFAFSSSEAATFECRVDQAPFAACSSPYTTASLGDGPHSFEVRATDPAGNSDQSPATRSFTVAGPAAAPTLLGGGPLGTVPPGGGLGSVLPPPESGLKRCPTVVVVGADGTVKLCEASNPPVASTVQSLTIGAASTPARKRKTKKPKVTLLASGKTAIPAGATRVMTAKLSASARTRLRKRRTLRVTATIVATGPNGKKATVKRLVTLKAAKKTKKPRRR